MQFLRWIFLCAGSGNPIVQLVQKTHLHIFCFNLHVYTYILDIFSQDMTILLITTFLCRIGIFTTEWRSFFLTKLKINPFKCLVFYLHLLYLLIPYITILFKLESSNKAIHLEDSKCDRRKTVHLELSLFLVVFTSFVILKMWFWCYYL